MGTADTVAELTQFDGRGAGTNAERRAAGWLAGELRRGRRGADVETFWCRPNWALAHGWHAGLALAGSLIAVGSATVGAALIAVALVSLVADSLTGVSLGRRLTREHASQNVVGHASQSGVGATPDPRPTRLVVTANYDSGRTGLVYRPAIRRPFARLRRLVGGRAPGWQGWLAIAFVWLLVTAILRARGSAGTTIDAVQLVPTAALVLATAALLELASAPFGPGANDNASGVAVALALARALEVAPPQQLGVELVLQGASDGSMIGLRRHLRRHRAQHRAANTIVLGIAACGGPSRTWWTGDGALIPLRFLPRLSQIAQRAVGPDTALAASGHRGRGCSPALPGRFAGLPAITIGSLDGDGLPLWSHRAIDLPAALDRGSLDRMLELALTLVDSIDADLRQAASDTAAASRTAA